MVGILVGARGARRDKLWRVLIWARILGKLKGFMLILWNFLSWIPELMYEEGPWHKSPLLQEIQCEMLGQRDKA